MSGTSRPTFPPSRPAGPAPARPESRPVVSLASRIDPDSSGRRLPALRRWWPSALAVVMSAASWGIDAAAAGQLLPLLPMIYVALVVIGRRSASWPLLALGSACFLLLQSQVAVDPTLGFAVIAGCVVVAGLLANGGRELLLQTSAMVLWFALVLGARAAAPDTSQMLLALGWIAHGGWDLWHLRRNKVASRTYAQWCGVFDVLMGVQLVAA